jgi:hypothetical protein
VRLEHLGRQDFANAALQCQPSVAEPAVRRLPRSLGAEVHQAAAIVAQLGEGEAATVADVRIVLAELVPVIAQRQRLRQRVGQRREATERPGPFLVAQRVEPHLRRGAIVAEAQYRLRKIRGRGRVPQRGAEIEQRDGGAVCLRAGRHVWIWRSTTSGRNHGRL